MTTARIFEPHVGWVEPAGIEPSIYGPLIAFTDACGCTAYLHPRYVFALPAGREIAFCNLYPRSGHA